MGGAVSELRAEIHAHALLVRHYPTLLEPVLAGRLPHTPLTAPRHSPCRGGLSSAVQFFLRTAEAGEGADGERALEDPAMDLVIADKQRLLVDEASTEVELLAENPAVMRALLLAVRDWRLLALSPDIDPRLRWYDPPWQRGERRDRPMPRPLEVPEDEVPRFRTAVLRTSVRCLRLLMLCADGREQLEAAGGPELLNRAALDNPLDDFVQADVKAIFRAVYGGENAVRRIAISGVPTVVEMMRENTDSAIVQLAGVRRMCQLLAGDGEPPAVVVATDSPTRADQQQPAITTLLDEIDTFGAVTLAVETLARFDVDQYLALYVHVGRFIAYVAVRGAPRLRQSVSHLALSTHPLLSSTSQSGTPSSRGRREASRAASSSCSARESCSATRRRATRPTRPDALEKKPRARTSGPASAKTADTRRPTRPPLRC